MPSPAADAEVVEFVRFPAAGLSLEGRLHYPEAAAPTGAVVIAGPHPLLGGDMENNVVAGLASGLARRGAAVLRFNYRGVGGSDGPPPDVAAHLAEFWATSHVADEPHHRADLDAAAAALRGFVGPDAPVAAVGYSFGCSLLPPAALGPAPLALVAPTIGVHDYAALDHAPGPRLVVAAHRDFATDAARLEAWFAGLGGRKRLVRGEWDDHFFRGCEDELTTIVSDFFATEWEARACR